MSDRSIKLSNDSWIWAQNAQLLQGPWGRFKTAKNSYVDEVFHAACAHCIHHIVPGAMVGVTGCDHSELQGMGHEPCASIAPAALVDVQAQCRPAADVLHQLEVLRAIGLGLDGRLAARSSMLSWHTEWPRACPRYEIPSLALPNWPKCDLAILQHEPTEA